MTFFFRKFFFKKMFRSREVKFGYKVFEMKYLKEKIITKTQT